MSDKLPSVMITLQDRQLLIPAVALVKVEPMAGLIVESRREPWLLGHKHWFNQRVPVIAFEIMAGGHLRKHSEKARIAIFQSAGESESMPFWGMLVQDEARLFDVSEEDLKLLNDQPSEAEMACVSVQDQPVNIPNLQFVEQRLAASGVTDQSLVL